MSKKWMSLIICLLFLGFTSITVAETNDYSLTDGTKLASSNCYTRCRHSHDNCLVNCGKSCETRSSDCGSKCNSTC